MSTDYTATPLPSFKRPPVIEVALSVLFAPLSEWNIPHFGLFWQTIRREFPKYSVQPPLASDVESFDRPIVRRELQLMLTQQPDARCWYLTDDEHQLIQIQRDRFVFNWRKLDSEIEYPRYEKYSRPELERNWNRFTSFVQSEGLPSCDVVQCELTYVNHIPKGQGWNTVEEWHKVFSFFEWKPTILPPPEGARFGFACIHPDKKGRLRIEANHGLRQSDGQELLVLNFTCRSKPVSSNVQDILSCMDFCREAMRVTLKVYAEQYIQRVDGSEGYGRQFKWLVNALEKALGRSPVFVDEITTEVINFMVRLWKPTMSTTTVRSRRNMLYRLAKIASRDDGLKVRPPKPVRDDMDGVKRRYHAPSAWTAQQVAKLVQVARQRFGYFRVGKVPIAGVTAPQGQPWVTKSAYWESYLRSAWDCGLRPCDLTRLRLDDIGPDGKFSIVTQKTGRVVTRWFRPKTLEAIARSFSLSPQRELIWPVWSSRGTWFRTRKRLLKRAGLSGGMNKLRHSAGTAVEVMQPGSGHAFLGNSEEVFQRHYFDQRHATNIPQPPPLPEVTDE